MSEWTLHIRYSGKEYQLRAVMEYHSAQIMRIRVFGTTDSILLENNYPTLAATKNKRGMQWKIREGENKFTNPKNARLLVNIMEYLEAVIKDGYPVG